MDFAGLVHDALGKLYDPVAMQTHPLGRLVPAAASGGGARQVGRRAEQAGKALRQWLLGGIEQLRPPGRVSEAAPAWRAHRLLELRYVEALDPGAVQSRLGISKAQYYREQSRALEALVSVLRTQIEDGAEVHNGDDTAVEVSLAAPPATPDQNVGAPTLQHATDLPQADGDSRTRQASHLSAAGGPTPTTMPTGTVTFLFTDVEGSTKLLNAHPDAYREAISRHHALLAGAVRANGGVVFETVGDAVYAAFGRTTDAVAAAVQGQMALQVEEWGETPIRVRMGLHLGEAELQGEHYFGAALYRCARLMAIAHGEQIVLSEVVAAAVRDGLPAGTTLVDLGEQRLRDLARPERTYQVVADGLASDFPALRSLDRLPTNLPAQATAFVGREALIESLRDRLLEPEVRLLTLTGPGGTGKTRLSLQVAADLLDAFADGVYLVQLAAVSDPGLVASTIAQVLDVKEVAGRPLREALIGALREQRMLLVLDNFEQLLVSPSGSAGSPAQDAASLVADLLANCRQVKVLATSRAPLRLYGEQEVPVPPLALPDRRAAPTADHLSQSEAVRLFVSRARSARPDFAVSNENAAVVAEICHRLDGLPLAIELAAARLRSLPLRALLERLEHRLPLLTGGARDLPARQQTLRNAIAWSYDLLTPDEQALFRRLAVFRGGTVEAVEDVCAGAAPKPGSTSVALAPLGIDVFEGVTSLAEKSLVNQEEAEDGQPWYVMLETVREFALERLEESAEGPAVRRRHTLYYLRLAEELDIGQGPNAAQRLDCLEREHDNYREVFIWCEAKGYGEPALRLAGALGWFWSVRGHTTEGRERFTSVLARFKAAGVNRVRAPLYARALVAAGRLAAFQGDLASGQALQEQALHTLEEHGDTEGTFSTLLSLGVFAGQAGDYDLSRRYLERAVHVARGAGDLVGAVLALSDLAVVAADEGDYDLARVVAEECQAVGDQAGDLISARQASWALAWVALDRGEFELATSHMERVLHVAETIGDTRVIAVVRANFASISAAKGDFADARRYLTESLQLNQSIKDLAGIAFSLEGFATASVLQGHFDRALRLAGAAAAIRRDTGIALPIRAQGRLDAKLAPACEALGEAAAGAAFAAGQALCLEEVIVEALTPEPDTAAAPASGPDKVNLSVLSPREVEVAVLIAEGCTNRQIAERLVITEGTAANHVVHILDKLGFSSRTQVGVWAAEQGLHKQ